MASTPELTLESLVENGTLGLTVLVPGDLTVRVRGAHTMEISQPNRWLESGWLLLTTGLRFLDNDDTASQVALVHQLKHAKAAGLAFGVGVNFEQVPQALVDAARGAGLTLLAVAADVPFAAVESYVNRSLVAAETYVAKRALWIQTDLLQSLSAQQPLTSLVNRIGHIIKGVAIVYDEAGTAVASTGSGPTRLIWAEIRAREARRQRFLVGRWHVATRPIVLEGMSYWIAIGSQQAHVLDDLAEPLLDSAQRLLGAIRAATALKATEARAEANELLTVLGAVVEPAEAPNLWERLAAFRFRMHAPLRAFVSTELTGRAKGGIAVPATLDQFVEDAQSNALPLIVRTRDAPEPAGWIGIATDSAVLHEWIDKLGEGHHVGVSEPFVDLTLGRRSFRDAHRASLVAQRRAALRSTLARRQTGTKATRLRSDLPVTGCVVRFEDVDLATWLLSSRSAEAIADKSRQQLGDLLDHSDLVDTAVAYLACGLDIQRTAARLYLHPNSVRYRLRRIEQIIDSPLSSPSALVNLYLAFHERLAAEGTEDEDRED
ncbi:MAG: PucR family transcriptional regulator [Micrococcales bacterium]|nr:PucR family transcriptional regulator [Micrococcales bacterium]